MTDRSTECPVARRIDTALSGRLKGQTRDWHNRAAGHPFERRLISGEATRDYYARYLGQLLHVHLVLEQPLRDRQSQRPIFAPILHGYHFRAAALVADLHALGHRPGAHPALPATALLCGRITDLAEQAPVALLGTLYVLEGSTNGGRLIADVARRSLNLPPGAGTDYLDPHGPAQPERWRTFKAALDALVLGPADRDAVIAAACDAFRGVHDILEDLTHTLTPAVVAMRSPPLAAARLHDNRPGVSCVGLSGRLPD